MDRIDFSPLYRSTVGFDRLSSLFDNALQYNQGGNSYPPYNIETQDDSRYRITLALAGFEEPELDIEVEKGVLKVSGKKAQSEDKHGYLYQGIAHRSFERRFQLADHVEVVGASFVNGLLSIDLLKELPEAMKPRRVSIDNSQGIEHQAA